MNVSHETITNKMEQIAQRISVHSCPAMNGRIPLSVAKRLVRAEVKELIARSQLKYPLHSVNEMLDFTFNQNFFNELAKINEKFVASLN